jgi:hypothetical protein
MIGGALGGTICVGSGACEIAAATAAVGGLAYMIYHGLRQLQPAHEGTVVGVTLNGNLIYSQSNRKGERGKTAKPEGTPNPAKHAKPDPNRPGRWLVKDPHTGKYIPKPPGWKPE